MRYSVRLAGLLRCCESLEQAARRERQETDELQSVIGQLNGLWGMDGVAGVLRREARNMEEQTQAALSMAQAVKRICQIYQEMELAIIDAVDCPFRLTPRSGGCGAPVFPGSGAGGTALYGVTSIGDIAGGYPDGSGFGSSRAAASRAGGGDAAPQAGSEAFAAAEAEAVRQENLHLYTLLERYAWNVFAGDAGERGQFLDRVRQDLGLEA